MANPQQRFRQRLRAISHPPGQLLVGGSKGTKISQISLRVRVKSVRSFILSVLNAHAYDFQLQELRIGIVAANFCDNVDILPYIHAVAP